MKKNFYLITLDSFGDDFVPETVVASSKTQDGTPYRITTQIRDLKTKPRVVFVVRMGINDPITREADSLAVALEIANNC